MTARVFAFPDRHADLSPYEAWRSARGDSCPYDPPLALLIPPNGPEAGEATFVADGSDPRRLRIQVTVAKSIGRGEPILRVLDAAPDGNDLGGPVSRILADPLARPGPARDMMVGALDEIESLAAAHGFGAVAFVGPAPTLVDILQARSYRSEGLNLSLSLL